MAYRFDETDDLVLFAQSRSSKLYQSIATTYWLSDKYMIKDKISLAAYVKY